MLPRWCFSHSFPHPSPGPVSSLSGPYSLPEQSFKSRAPSMSLPFLNTPSVFLLNRQEDCLLHCLSKELSAHHTPSPSCTTSARHLDHRRWNQGWVLLGILLNFFFISIAIFVYNNLSSMFRGLVAGGLLRLSSWPYC